MSSSANLDPPRLPFKPRICAVSYLNTVPLVWGMLHGEQSLHCELDFQVPSECADQVETGQADFGIVPVIEVQRQGLLAAPGTGIACDGDVRSILLVSRTEPGRIKTLAADTGSRTSVVLARILLRGIFGADPEILPMRPDLAPMMERADAALMIGDAALRLDLGSLPYQALDLGRLWRQQTGLPMVFAVWAGKPHRMEPLLQSGIEDFLLHSLQYGLQSLNTIVESESRSRGFSPELIRRYLTQHIRFRIGEAEQQGLREFLRHAATLDPLLTLP